MTDSNVAAEVLPTLARLFVPPPAPTLRAAYRVRTPEESDAYLDSFTDEPDDETRRPS